jgi:hypothetical protein
MKKIYYCKIGKEGTGLCNQLFSLVTCIMTAINNNQNIIIIDNIRNEYTSNSSNSNISDIFDISKFNNYLKNNYNIFIFDKNNIKFKIKSIKYGVKDIKLDITDYILNNYFRDNILHIKKNLNLNSIAGDPVPDKQKFLFIKYKINNVYFKESFSENLSFLKDDIIFNLNKENYNYIFEWINFISRDIFDEILKNIVFNDKINNFVSNFLKKKNINENDKINILHLRLEEDAMTHWSVINNMNINKFRQTIENKYIDIIKNFINKNDKNVILSYSLDNTVIDYLKKNNYQYYFIEKDLNIGREINAIYDLVVGKCCNNIFIGNFNLNNLNGSSFSYCLIKRFENKVKKILIDLDKIMDMYQLIN